MQMLLFWLIFHLQQNIFAATWQYEIKSPLKDLHGILVGSHEQKESTKNIQESQLLGQQGGQLWGIEDRCNHFAMSSFIWKTIWSVASPLQLRCGNQLYVSGTRCFHWTWHLQLSKWSCQGHVQSAASTSLVCRRIHPVGTPGAKWQAPIGWLGTANGGTTVVMAPDSSGFWVKTLQPPELWATWQLCGDDPIIGWYWHWRATSWFVNIYINVSCYKAQATPAVRLKMRRNWWLERNNVIRWWIKQSTHNQLPHILGYPATLIIITVNLALPINQQIQRVVALWCYPSASTPINRVFIQHHWPWLTSTINRLLKVHLFQSHQVQYHYSSLTTLKTLNHHSPSSTSHIKLYHHVVQCAWSPVKFISEHPTTTIHSHRRWEAAGRFW